MKEGKKPEYMENTPDDDLQKMSHTKAQKFTPQARLEPAQWSWWQARQADLLTVTPRVTPDWHPLSPFLATCALPRGHTGSPKTHDCGNKNFASPLLTSMRCHTSNTSNDKKNPFPLCQQAVFLCMCILFLLWSFGGWRGDWGRGGGGKRCCGTGTYFSKTKILLSDGRASPLSLSVKKEQQQTRTHQQQSTWGKTDKCLITTKLD